MLNLSQRSHLRAPAQERSAGLPAPTAQYGAGKRAVRSRPAVQRCRTVEVDAILTPEKPTLVQVISLAQHCHQAAWQICATGH